MGHGVPGAARTRPARQAQPPTGTTDSIDVIDTATTAALVVELSQLEHALRLWQKEQGRGKGPTELDFRALMHRKDAVLRDLRGRGLDFTGVQPAPDAPAARPDPHARPSAPDELTARRNLGQEAVVAHLERALVTRSLVGQAMGILMERHHLDARGAFDVLAHASSVTNRRLSEVAAQLTSSRTLPGGR